MKYLVTLEGRTWEVAVAGNTVSVNGKDFQAELRVLEGTPLRTLILDGRAFSFAMESGGHGGWTVLADGERRELEVLDERAAQLRALSGAGAAHAGPLVLRAPMPGLVVRVLAEPGQKVVEGTGLIILEAMKMENQLKAAAPGVVERITTAAGRTVEKGEVLITFLGTPL